MVSTLAGLVGTAGAIGMWLPQVFAVEQAKRQQITTQGISWHGYLIGVVFNILLFAYGVENGAAFVIAAGLVNTICCTILCIQVSSKATLTSGTAIASGGAAVRASRAAAGCTSYRG